MPSRPARAPEVSTVSRRARGSGCPHGQIGAAGGAVGGEERTFLRHAGLPQRRHVVVLPVITGEAALRAYVVGRVDPDGVGQPPEGGPAGTGEALDDDQRMPRDRLPPGERPRRWLAWASRPPPHTSAYCWTTPTHACAQPPPPHWATSTMTKHSPGCTPACRIRIHLCGRPWLQLFAVSARRSP